MSVAVGQFSDQGRKALNQDFHGFYAPNEPLRSLKGVALAMADGISSSNVSQVASETAVTNFLDDYFCTSEAWSVKHSVTRVLSAANAWLYAQSQQSPLRYEQDKGYVCTFSALVIKATTAHLFHAGDTRIYRLQGQALEQLTHDHRLWVSEQKSYLSRALGVEAHIEFDYQALPLKSGDIFILATDGVYEHSDAEFIISSINAHPDDLDQAAKVIVTQAFERGSPDNLSLQIIRIESLPQQESSALQQQIEQLPLPPLLDAGADFDGYRILREIHASHRSHVYLALDSATQTQVVLKTPSIDQQDDPAYLERFLMEEWVARRLNSVHLLKAAIQSRPRNYLYSVTEFIEGQTLKQWLIDNPRPDLEKVRSIIEQIAKGLRALHRMEILHQDIRPDNIMIDATGTVKIIDFGSASVAGILEAAISLEQEALLGTAMYSAPEYFLGEVGSRCSDLYALGVLTYHMLSGRFPYGTQVAQAKTLAAQRRLSYSSVLDEERAIPAWIDATLKKALHPSPDKRYQELSEFIFDLRHPNKAFVNQTRPPLIERNPVLVWQLISALLGGIILLLLNR